MPSGEPAFGRPTGSSSKVGPFGTSGRGQLSARSSTGSGSRVWSSRHGAARLSASERSNARRTLPAAVMAALSFSGAAVVESKISGVEVASGLVGVGLEALPLVEIVPKSGVYDYAARYTAGATEYFAPARLDQGTSAEVVERSRHAASALGLRDLTRVDLIVDDHGEPWVLEVNVSPGMTDTSLIPMAAHAAGMSLADVCDAVIQSASRTAWVRPEPNQLRVSVGCEPRAGADRSPTRCARGRRGTRTRS